MSDSAERLRLARAAARLAAQSGRPVPPLVLMTDDRRLPDPLSAARALPRGSLVVVRARDATRRKHLTAALRRVARARGLAVLVSSDAVLATTVDGLHLPEARLGEAAHWRARRGFVITGSVHSLASLKKALHVDAVFLSPVFPTASHPGGAALGPVRANLIARQARMPLYALGGITARNAALVSAFSGIAAIGALA